VGKKMKRIKRRSFIQRSGAAVVGAASVSKAESKADKSIKTGPLEPGERVHISDKMPECMSHFEHGCDGTIMYSSYQMYRSRNFKSKPLVDGVDMNEYSVCIDGHGPVSWYPSILLTRIRTKQKLAEDK